MFLAFPLIILGLVGSFKSASLLVISLVQTAAYLSVVKLRFIRTNFWSNLGFNKLELRNNLKLGLKYWLAIEATAWRMMDLAMATFWWMILMIASTVTSSCESCQQS